jgi:hypothetical protein
MEDVRKVAYQEAGPILLRSTVGDVRCESSSNSEEFIALWNLAIPIPVPEITARRPIPLSLSLSLSLSSPLRPRVNERSIVKV